MIFVGTGRYLGVSDLTDTNQQSLYAIRDDLMATGWGDIRASGCLQQQTLTATSANLRTTSNVAVDFLLGEVRRARVLPREQREPRRDGEHQRGG